MLRLTNKIVNMEIGICKFAGFPALYVKEGKYSRIYATFLSQEKAEMFMRKLYQWDRAGGNDGGIEK